MKLRRLTSDEVWGLLILVGIILWALGYDRGPIQDPQGRYL